MVAPFLVTLIPTGGFINEYDLTFTPTYIDWGNVTIGVSVTKNVNITNTGKEIVNLTANATNPSDNLFNFTVSWIAEGNALPYNASLVTYFTLTVYNATAGPFKFDIEISDKG